MSGLPIDPDIEGPQTPLASRGRSRWPRLSPRVLVVVFAGGVFGGLARYGIGLAASPATDGFPWDVFAINVGGSFALALLLILVLEVLRPSQWLRPAVGTGFLGAFTTFSSFVVAADHLAAHGRPGLAAGYVFGSMFAGLAAGSFGLVVGRAVSANRHHTRRTEGTLP